MAIQGKKVFSNKVYHQYEIEAGDSFESIGACLGYSAKKIRNFYWQGCNVQLRSLGRGKLIRGEILLIPLHLAKIEKKNHYTIDQTRELKLKLLKEGKPRSREIFWVDDGKQQQKGYTDSRGRLSVKVARNLEAIKLILGKDKKAFTVFLQELPEENQKNQARLRNLGFYNGAIDGILGEKTLTAIKQFQQKYQIPKEPELNSIKKDLAQIAKL